MSDSFIEVDSFTEVTEEVISEKPAFSWFLPYEMEVCEEIVYLRGYYSDSTSRTNTLWGIGVGGTRIQAEQRLKELILDSLLHRAQNGIDIIKRLESVVGPALEDSISFTKEELEPVYGVLNDYLEKQKRRARLAEDEIIPIEDPRRQNSSELLPESTETISLPEDVAPSGAPSTNWPTCPSESEEPPDLLDLMERGDKDVAVHQIPAMIDKINREIISTHDRFRRCTPSQEILEEVADVFLREEEASGAKDPTPNGVVGVLERMQKTFVERGNRYGDSCSRAGSVLKALLPNGVRVTSEADFTQMAILGIIAHKLCRHLNDTRFDDAPVPLSSLGHQDSLHDLAVYCAILEDQMMKTPPSEIPDPPKPEGLTDWVDWR